MIALSAALAGRFSAALSWPALHRLWFNNAARVPARHAMARGPHPSRGELAARSNPCSYSTTAPGKKCSRGSGDPGCKTRRKLPPCQCIAANRNSAIRLASDKRAHCRASPAQPAWGYSSETFSIFQPRLLTVARRSSRSQCGGIETRLALGALPEIWHAHPGAVTEHTGADATLPRAAAIRLGQTVVAALCGFQ